MVSGNEFCREHSGVKVELVNIKKDISALWNKWDNMQKMIVGIFITLSMNLLGVIILLIRMGN